MVGNCGLGEFDPPLNIGSTKSGFFSDWTAALFLECAENASASRVRNRMKEPLEIGGGMSHIQQQAANERSSKSCSRQSDFLLCGSLLDDRVITVRDESAAHALNVLQVRVWSDLHMIKLVSCRVIGSKSRILFLLQSLN